MPRIRSATTRIGQNPGSTVLFESEPSDKQRGWNVTAELGKAGFSGVVALDGPSGTGKSTVARQLATRLDIRYMDTGAMYRAATLAALAGRIDLSDSAAIAHCVSAIDLRVSTDPRQVATWLDGRRVDSEIRSDAVTAAVSAVSAVAAVRTQLVAVQRCLIGEGGIVVEGRDIGTVVWPAARPKVYLTAEVEVRAQRRASEIGTQAVTEVAASIARRDESDSGRVASPLIRAVDAVDLDTTYLSIDEVVQRLVDMTIEVMADS
jgi:CMP/dCMP kinase